MNSPETPFVSPFEVDRGTLMLQIETHRMRRIYCESGADKARRADTSYAGGGATGSQLLTRRGLKGRHNGTCVGPSGLEFVFC